MTEFVQAKQSFTGMLAGKSITVERGEVVAAQHPMVAKWPRFFEPLHSRFSTVEQTTRRPGRITIGRHGGR